MGDGCVGGVLIAPTKGSGMIVPPPTAHSHIEPVLFRPTCTHWVGYRPCAVQAQTGTCAGCAHYQPAPITTPEAGRRRPYDPRMLSVARTVGLVEMGGLGSHLRTSAVTRAIRDRNPNVRVLWLTHTAGTELLRYVPGVTPVDIRAGSQAAELASQTDVLISFETSDLARRLVTRARVIAGFAVNSRGRFEPASRHAEELQRLQVDNTYRRSYPRTFQHALLAAVGLDTDPHYDLELPTPLLARAHQRLTDLFGDDRPGELIGLNIGTSQKGHLKRWPVASWIDLALHLAHAHPNARIALLAGPEERVLRTEIITRLNCDRPGRVRLLDEQLIGDFLATIGYLSLLVTADTLALHAARAQNVPVIALAGPMPHRELELAPTDATVGPALPCAPCYLYCHQPVPGLCMRSIQVSDVADHVQRRLTEPASRLGRTPR